MVALKLASAQRYTAVVQRLKLLEFFSMPAAQLPNLRAKPTNCSFGGTLSKSPACIRHHLRNEGAFDVSAWVGCLHVTKVERQDKMADKLGQLLSCPRLRRVTFGDQPPLECC